jgi:hypothetical protein
MSCPDDDDDDDNEPDDYAQWFVSGAGEDEYTDSE